MTTPQGTLQLPPPMSTFASDIDSLYNFIYWFSVVSFLLIVGLMIAYVVKFRRVPGRKAQPTGHSTILEIAWTASPLLLLGYLFHQGFTTYIHMAVPPSDAYEVHVTATQWKWDFTHPRYGTEPNLLVVPVDTPVKVVMGSGDVLHSFYVPAFRTKRDAVPGMLTTLWFEPTHITSTIGENGMPSEGDEGLTLFCTEYCGAAAQNAEGTNDYTVENGLNSNHSTMLARVHVVSAEDFQRYLEGLQRRGDNPPEDCVAAHEGDEDAQMTCWGEQLYTQKSCNTCHSTTAGASGTGPSWADTGALWGQPRELASGAPTNVDDEYIRESILNPGARIAGGFNNLMAPQSLTDNQIRAVTAYIRSLGAN